MYTAWYIDYRLNNHIGHTMTNAEFISIAKDKLQSSTTEELIQSVTELYNNMSDGIEVVMNAILLILEERMNEADFINLCESL